MKDTMEDVIYCLHCMEMIIHCLCIYHSQSTDLSFACALPNLGQGLVGAWS